MASSFFRAKAVRALCDSFGCRYPVFGLSHSPAVVAAITDAGGVGIWAAARHLPDEISREAEWIRSKVGSGVFGINVMLPSQVPDSADRADLVSRIPQGHFDFVDGLYDKYGVPRDDEVGERNRIVRSKELFATQVASAIAGPADIFVTAVGADATAAENARANGLRVGAVIGAPKHVPSALTMKPDLLVAQGYDAGGHTGRVGTFTLVPRIVELSGGVPVLAAGGVGTGRHVLAAVALGAAGVWLGTLWLGTDEFGASATLLRKLLDATCEDTVITRASSGKPMRQIRTAWSDEWAKPAAPEPLPMPIQDQLVGSLEGAVFRHNVEALVYSPAGQSVEWIREPGSVAQTMRRLMDETEQASAEW